MSTQPKLHLNLLGKDYLTQDEAAHYCCMCTRQFQRIAQSENIWPASFGGKLIYRRADLLRAMEGKWQDLEELTGLGSWTGARLESANDRSSGAKPTSRRKQQAG